MLQWTWGHKHLYLLVFSSSLDKYPELRLLIHMEFYFRLLRSLHSDFCSGCTFLYSYCQASVCSLVLSWHNEDLKWRTLKPSATALGSWTERVIALRSRTDCVLALRQISVTAPCYSSILLRNSRKIHPLGVKACRPKDGREEQRTGERERERPSALWLLFLYVPTLPAPGLPYVNWASQECFST